MFVSKMVDKDHKKFWGETWWDILHIMSFSMEYLPFLKFLNLLVYALPCDYCSKNLEWKLKNVNWEVYKNIVPLMGYNLHKKVNEHISTTIADQERLSPPYTEVVEKYENMLRHRWLAWKTIFWNFMFILGTSYRCMYSDQYKKLIFSIVDVMASQTVKNYFYQNHLERYLHTKEDLFFFVYQAYTTTDKNEQNNCSLVAMKDYYHKSMGEMCTKCKV